MSGSMTVTFTQLQPECRDSACPIARGVPSSWEHAHTWDATIQTTVRPRIGEHVQVPRDQTGGPAGLEGRVETVRLSYPPPELEGMTPNVAVQLSDMPVWPRRTGPAGPTRVEYVPR